VADNLIFSAVSYVKQAFKILVYLDVSLPLSIYDVKSYTKYINEVQYNTDESQIQIQYRNTNKY